MTESKYADLRSSFEMRFTLTLYGLLFNAIDPPKSVIVTIIFSEQFAGATSSSSLMAEAQGKTKGDAGLDAEGGEEKVVDTNTETPAAPVEAPAVPVEAPAAPVEAPAVPEEASAEAPAAAADDEKTALNALYGKKKKKKKKKKAFVPDV